MGVWCNESLHGPTRCNSKAWRCSGCPTQRCCFAHRSRCATLRGDRCVHDVRLESMVLDSVHRVACATDMVQSQSWEPVPVEAAVKTGKCGWYTVQVCSVLPPQRNLRTKCGIQVFQAFVERIEEGMTVFDIGAHIGLFTLGAAKRVGRRGRVYAFEPSPETAEVLERHVRLNGWQNRVEVVRAVVSDVDGVVPFYAHGLSMAASLGRENVEVLNPEQPDTPTLKIEITSVTLDQF